MNKLLEWFVDKNFSTKIFITIVVAATLLSAVIFIGSLINPASNTPEPSDDPQATSEPIPTEEPVSTPTPSPTPEVVPHEDNPEEIIEFNAGNYTNDQLKSLTEFVKQATEAHCLVDYYETFEQRTARLAPYFAPDSVPMQESSINPTTLMQTCSSLGTTIIGADDETGNMVVSTMVGMYDVDLLQLDLPKEERVAKTSTKTYTYELVFTDKWVVVVANI